jgi:hypothetical protein
MRRAMTTVAGACRHGRTAVVALTCTGLLVAAGCGSDDDDAPSGDASTVAVTLTEEGIEGLPAELSAGVVEVTVDDQTEGGGGEVNFTRVEPGTDTATFVEGLAGLFGGGPFPDYFLNTAGAIGTSLVPLDEGDYVVWFDKAADLDRESTADDIVSANMTVGAGDDDAEIEGADGTIESTDYAFTVDVPTGPATIRFNNASDQQFHHVVLVDFGTNDPATVEENLPTLLESEDPTQAPAGIDAAQINFEFAESAVYGPGSSGTFEATFEPGTTYAALCFIQDRAGGAPHAIQHQMYDVFQLEG